MPEVGQLEDRSGQLADVIAQNLPRLREISDALKAGGNPAEAAKLAAVVADLGRVAKTTVAPPSMQAVEFSWPLHILRHPRQEAEPNVFTIGVWRETTLEVICLRQPLQAAVLALGRELTRETTKAACGCGAGADAARCAASVPLEDRR